MDSTSIKQSPAVKTNSLRAWILSARPKTLAGAVAPVLVGAVFGFSILALGGNWKACILPAILCFLFAVLMQIDANFINDYFDFKKGADTKDRLGPERACTQGWITPGAMKTGIAITTILAFLTGLPLIWYGGWFMLVVGVICILGAFLYTTVFSRIGLGDLLVVIFFGVVPVFFTFHVIFWHGCNLSAMFTGPGDGGGVVALGYIVLGWMPLLAGVAMGLITNNLLIVNNYRDRDQDLTAGKITLVNSIGPKATEWLYLINGILGVLLMCLICSSWKNRIVSSYSDMSSGFPYHLVIALLFLPFLFSTHRKMVKINHGKELNKVLGETARNILIYSVLFVISIILVTLPVWYSR